MRIKWTRLYVDDQEKALQFYTEKLGFALEFLGRPDPARAMADALKLGRLTASSRAEFESLLSDVAQDAS